MKKIIIYIFILLEISCIQNKAESSKVALIDATKENVNTQDHQLGDFLKIKTGNLFNFSSLVTNQNAKYNGIYNLLAFNHSKAYVLTGDGKDNNLLYNCDYYFSEFLEFDKTKEYGFFLGHTKNDGDYELVVLPLRGLTDGKCNVSQTIRIGEGIRVHKVKDGFVISQFGGAQYWNFENGKLAKGAYISICPFDNKKDCKGNRIGGIHTSWFSFNDYLIAFESDFYYSSRENHYFEIWQLKDGKIVGREQINDYRFYEVTKNMQNISSSEKILWMEKFIRANMKACIAHSTYFSISECLQFFVKSNIPEHIDDPYSIVPVSGTRYVLYKSPDYQNHIWDLINNDELVNPVLADQIASMYSWSWLMITETRFIRPLQGEKVIIDISNYIEPIKIEPSEYAYILPEDDVGFVKTSEDKDSRIFRLKKLN